MFPSCTCTRSVHTFFDLSLSLLVSYKASSTIEARPHDRHDFTLIRIHLLSSRRCRQHACLLRQDGRTRNILSSRNCTLPIPPATIISDTKSENTFTQMERLEEEEFTHYTCCVYAIAALPLPANGSISFGPSLLQLLRCILLLKTTIDGSSLWHTLA